MPSRMLRMSPRMLRMSQGGVENVAENVENVAEDVDEINSQPYSVVVVAAALELIIKFKSEH